MQFNNPTSTKNENENKKYNNSRLKKINQPVALAARFPSHPAHPRRSCAFTSGLGGSPGPVLREHTERSLYVPTVGDPERLACDASESYHLRRDWGDHR